MSKNKLRWFWYFSAVVIVCLTGVILRPYIFESDPFVFYLVCAYVVVYSLALVIGYGLLRKLSMLVSVGFVVYIAIAVGGNILINFLLFRLYFVSPLLFALIVFMLLVFLNFALSKVIFAVSIREACLIGMLISLINTLLSIMIGPAFFV